MADPRSGVNDQGDWAPAFPGQREPFQPGHTLSVRHGGYSTFTISKRAEEIANDLVMVVPGFTPADLIGVRSLATALANVEALTLAMEKRKRRPTTKRDYMAEDLRKWISIVHRWCDSLALTPTSRGRLGLDVARTGDALERHLAERYGVGLDGEPVQQGNGAGPEDAAHARGDQ